MEPWEELESRANAGNEFVDFEQACANCGRMYGYHEKRVWYGVVAYVCPEKTGVFVLPEADDGL